MPTQFPVYIIVDIHGIARTFRQGLMQIVHQLIPESTVHAVDNGMHSLRRAQHVMQDPRYWTAQQWYEELINQIMASFTTDFQVYGRQLQDLPYVAKLLKYNLLTANPVFVHELKKLTVAFGLDVYFAIRDQGYFPVMSQVQYLLHHPSLDSLVLTSGDDPYYFVGF